MTTHKKTQLTSARGAFKALEQKGKHEGKFHIFSSTGSHPLFTYDVTTNRLVYVGGVASISPEGLADIADLCAGIFDRDNS